MALTFAACALHATVGFGSGPLLMPLLLALTTPARAVVAAVGVGVGMVVNGLQLGAERRRPQLPVRRLWPLLASAVPGAALGALVAGRLDHRAVAVALAIALLISGAALVAAPHRLAPGVLAGGGIVAGFSAALTGVFGPVLGVMVTGAGCRGDALRDGIGASFLVVGTCAIAATLAVSGGATGLLLAVALTPPAAAGHAVGRGGFARLTERTHRAAVLGAVAAGCAAALLPLVL
ncbi:TSUP family transporter [Conexibacter woesei]|uniref:TSUP family transporter n=1 Tax=Conexibacter woesei TaxID=191495 RepID=UPI0004787696|nr:TSUP family transporter [Conexibacter woesei]